MPEFESLDSPREFRRVLRDGTRRRSGDVVVVKCPGEAGTTRVGLVVSKGSGTAVTRNRIRRRLRHALRALQLEPGNDYVIIASSQVADVPHPRLMGWLERALGSRDA